MEPIVFIFGLIVVLFSAIVHEVVHGLMALYLGDETAKMAGRLTFNPIPHIDPYGSVLMPLILGLTSGGQFLFAYAKPVPFNPYNLKNQRWGPALVAAAGPVSNFVIAFSLIALFRVLGDVIPSQYNILIVQVVIVNMILGVFNSIPIPPLDGSKILASVLPYNAMSIKTQEFLNQNGLLLVIFFALFIFPLFSQYILRLTYLLLGIG